MLLINPGIPASEIGQKVTTLLSKCSGQTLGTGNRSHWLAIPITLSSHYSVYIHIPLNRMVDSMPRSPRKSKQVLLSPWIPSPPRHVNGCSHVKTFPLKTCRCFLFSQSLRVWCQLSPYFSTVSVCLPSSCFLMFLAGPPKATSEGSASRGTGDSLGLSFCWPHDTFLWTVSSKPSSFIFF